MSLLEFYLYYHKLRTSAPISFAKHLGIQALGHTLGRDSVCLIQPNEIHHNTYLCLLGVSGKALKTTAQEDVQESIIPDIYVGPKSFSPQGLLRQMTTVPQLICPTGEFSTVLRGLKTGGYMSDFKEIANNLHKCPLLYEKKLTDAGNTYRVERPYLSISTTCTEEEFLTNLNPQMVHGGFLPRWIVNYQDGHKERRKQLPENIGQIQDILWDILLTLYDYFKVHPLKFKLTDEALDLHNDICESLDGDEQYEGLYPFVSRYQDYIISYADILWVDAQLDRLIGTELTEITKINKITELSIKNLKDSLDTIDISDISVGEEFVQQGYNLLKPCLAYAKKIAQYVDEDLEIAKVTTQLDKLGEKVQWTKLLNRSKLKADMFAKVISTLVQREAITVERIASGEGQAKKETQFIIKR